MKEYLGMTGTDKREGERTNPEWFDVDRVDIDAGADKVVLNTTSSGPDVPAPTI